MSGSKQQSAGSCLCLQPATIYGLGVALIVIAGVIAYANSFSDTFVLDDYAWIAANTGIRRLSTTWLAMRHTGRPVLVLSLAINYWISALGVWSYHLFNLCIHLAAAITLMAIVRRTLLSAKPLPVCGRDATLLSAGVALLWVVHPLQTESVTYVIQRSESLMGLFYLLTLLLTIRGAGSARPLWWYIGSILCCALGMATKPVMVTAPILVLIYDRLFLSGSWSEVFQRRWTLYLGLAACWGWLIWLLHNAPASEWSETAGTSQAGMSVAKYALTQPGVILRYLRLSIAPWPLSLEYDWMLPTSTTAIESIVALLALIGLLGLFFRRQPLAWFLGAWFFMILLPTSSVIPISDPVVEHRMYLPLAAVITVLVLGGYQMYSRFVRGSGHEGQQLGTYVAIALILVIAAGLTYATYLRNKDYITAKTILTDAVTKHPGNARAQINLATAFLAEGNLDEAENHLRTALTLKPDSAEAYANLGVIAYQRHLLDDAIRDYDKSLSLNPKSAATHSLLGVTLREKGAVDLAISEYEKALELQPDFADAQYNLGLALAQAGQLDKAIAHWQRLAELEPGSYRAHNCLGIAYLRRGETARAVEHWERAIAANKMDVDLSARVAWILATSPDDALRNGSRAVLLAQQANQLSKGRNIGALRALAAAYAETGQFAAAVENVRRAIEVGKVQTDPGSVALLESQLRLYERGMPFRDATLSE